MADVIATRTIFMDPTATPINVCPWARVVLTDGTVGIEPYFQPFPRDAAVVSEGDECNRVDTIEYIDRTKYDNALSFGLTGDYIHGGKHVPEK